MRTVWKWIGVALCAVTALAILLHVQLYLWHHRVAGEVERYKVAVEKRTRSEEDPRPPAEPGTTTQKLSPPPVSGQTAAALAPVEKAQTPATVPKAPAIPKTETDALITGLLLRGGALEKGSPPVGGAAPAPAVVSLDAATTATTTTEPAKEVLATVAVSRTAVPPTDAAPHAGAVEAEKEQELPWSPSLQFDPTLPLLPQSSIGTFVLACRRADYLDRTLQGLAQVRGASSTDEFPVVVSQDCVPNDAVSQVVLRNREHLQGHIVYDRVAEQAALRANQTTAETTGQTSLLGATAPPAATPAPTPQALLKRGYAKIAEHFRFALQKAFLRFHQAIFLEDDLQASPDFFSFFRATLPALQNPQSRLLCVSAWNDQGLGTLVDDTAGVHRTEIFPGLGWMITRDVVTQELLPRWPPAYWDEFMRRPDVRKGRDCLRPEINRVWHFGFVGESRGQFSKYWKAIKRNDKAMDWSSPELARRVAVAADPQLYEQSLQQAIAHATYLSSPVDLNGYAGKGAEYWLRYTDFHSYMQLASFFQLMPDWKEGHVRSSYRHVLPLAYKGNRVYLVKDWPVVAPAKTGPPLA
ncbi:unnamed protein product [Amoebophrya sp. A120]|nr:unnamed protein product [Amoebophrya sp. A120]|eukprot:GSA120T00003351001.1